MHKILTNGAYFIAFTIVFGASWGVLMNLMMG